MFFEIKFHKGEKRMEKRKLLTGLPKWLFMLCMTLLVFAGVKTRVHAATEYDLWIGATRITSENCNDLSDIVVGPFARKTHSYFDPDTNTLYLDEVLRIDGNTMHNGTRSKIYSKLPLKIRGNAELNLKNEDDVTAISTESYLDIQGDFSFEGGNGALFAGQKITIDGENTKITITKTPQDSAAIYGLFGVCVNNGSINIEGYSDGIYSSWGDVCLFGGTYKMACNGGMAVKARKGGLFLAYGYTLNKPIQGRVGTYGDYSTIVKLKHEEGELDRLYAYDLDLVMGQDSICYVTFDTNEQLGFNSKQTSWNGRPKGSTFNRPEDPTREGYFFGGWYTSRDCRDGEEYDFNTKVERSITLYAKWNKGKQYNLWVDGTRVTTLNMDDIPVNANGKVSFDPANNTLNLDGWFGIYQDGETVNSVKSFIYTGMPIRIVGDADIVARDANAYPIYSYLGNVTIDGDIRISGANTSIFSAMGVKVDGKNTKLTIKDTDIGIFGGSGVTINNGIVDIDAKAYGLKTSAGLIDIQGGLTTIKAGQCAIYGGKQRSVNVADTVAILEPESYSFGKSQSGDPFYTIMGGDSKDAKTVRFDASRPVYTVTFDMNGQNVTAPKPQQIADGRCAHHISISNYPRGYGFGGWYIDKACTQGYDFSKPVHNSFTLYAEWVEDKSQIDPDKIHRPETDKILSGKEAKGRGSAFAFGRGQRFRVTSDDKANPTVTFERLTDKKATRVTVPKTVTVDDVTYTVTAVSSKAFKGCSKLKVVTLGSNIESIGANAFKGCSSLKTIKIQSTKLTKKSVAGKAFSGVSSNATIKVPAKMKKSYGKIFAKKGLSKSVKIK